MILRGLIAICLVLWSAMALAQTIANDAVDADATPAITLTPDAPDAQTAALESDSWERLAARVEEGMRAGTVSTFAINRFRSELAVWRDQFFESASVNAGRIATVEDQIAALGPVPEDADEAPAVADRRAALALQLRDLTAPRLLAQESFVRADGLIGELDAELLSRETAELINRGPTPINPVHVWAALAAVSEGVRSLGTEVLAGVGKEGFWTNLPRALAFVALAVLLIFYVRRWVSQRRDTFVDGQTRLLHMRSFLLSLWQVIIPVIGLLALATGIEVSGILGVRGAAIIDAVPEAGFAVVFAWWLTGYLFPHGKSQGFLDYSVTHRASARRYGVAIAIVLAFARLLDAMLATIDIAEGTKAAIDWPFIVLLGVLLWRFGRAIQNPPAPREDREVSQGRVRRIIGRLCTIVAVVAPVIAAIGYGEAGVTLMLSSIMSLGLIGFVIIMQRIVLDLSRPDVLAEDSKGFAALAPILINFVLAGISLPIFALIWGARVDDLAEIWVRFREGFSIGESRISPTDFLTFVIIFTVGYLLTRFVKSTLRATVLPRTRLDLGGQNAIVAGVGYVGILLAAIIAITSAGIDLSNLAILAGALSVGIGFGLQNIVSNFVSGIILLIERPISEGDWIEVAGQMGYVRAISVRSTRIETFDRTDVIVPNADLVSGQVTNWTRGNLVGRVIVPVGVAYGSDIELVKKILREIAEAHPMVLMTPEPSIIFQNFGADSLDFEIRAILRDVNYVVSTKSEMNTEIAARFAEAGIEIPFAQRDIWLRNPEVLKDQPA